MENLNSTPDVDKITKPVEETAPRTVHATIYPVEEVTHADNTEIKPAQVISNLPAELLSQPRFFAVLADKTPIVKDWSNPQNQSLYTDIKLADGQFLGFDICSHNSRAGYICVDVDHCFNDKGEFVSEEIARWVNLFFDDDGNAVTYAEKSISGRGLHFLFNPANPAEYKEFVGIKRLHVGNAAVEVFWEGTGRYILLTGNLYHCAAGTQISTDVDAVELIWQQIFSNEQKAKSNKPSGAYKSISNLPPALDVARVHECLKFIEPARISENYFDWLAVTSSIKHTLAACGMSNADAFSIFDDWCKKDNSANPSGKPRYDYRKNLASWQSLHDTDFDIGILIKKATDAGYCDKEFRRQWYADNPESVPPKSVPEHLRLPDEQRNFLFSGTLTDLINARRIAYLFKADLRYLTDADKWLTFGGQCWNIATNSNNTGVYSYAAKLADILRANAESKEDFALVKVFENLRTVNPALNYLKGVDSIRITRKDLNTHKNLLNCQNGVVDLETKKIYPQSPDLLLTQMIRADYRPAFYSDIVGNYFSSVMPDESTLAALLRYLGYGLTGEIIEHKALFIHGGGRNGKGTLTQFLLKLLGDYATPFPIRAVLAKYQSRDADAPTPAFSKLEFKRLAIAEEIPAGEKLDSAQFKILTGGDQLPIRHLHEEAAAIENPSQKMIFSGNNLPELDDTRDLGLVERFMVIKFTQTFIGANRDLNLQKKLFTPDALSGFLTLLVDNAEKWYKDGLIDSVAMESAKNEYLREQDFILDFIDENCVVKDVAIIRFTEFLEKLRKEYSMARTMSDRSLSTAVSKTLATIKGVEKRKAHGLYKIFGLGWKVDDEFSPVISDDFIGEPISDDQIPVKF